MKKIKEHIRYIYLAFFRYRRGFLYLVMRYVVAPKILMKKTPIEKPITHHTLSMHMLFGERDFLMACWSLGSFYANSEIIGLLYIHSDGTLSDNHKTLLLGLFPSAQIIDARDVVNDHKVFFNTHPTLKEFRTTYQKFQSKKLLDPYLSSDKEYRLILDSDMLWFQHPQEIEKVVHKNTKESFMMSDGEGDFAYVTFKDGTQISEEIASYNSGVTLYHIDSFNLERLVRYIDSIDYNNTRFTDQACYATVLKPSLFMLPKERYILKGELDGSRVMRHYTGPQRAKFYLLGLDRIWKDILYVCN